jgi:penicillin-binding protein 1A
MGITSAWYSPQFHTCSGTYALGVLDVSPLDMASAYGVFANHGLRAEPTPVLKVLDAKGRAIEDNTHPVTTKVLDPGVADTVTDILRGVIQYGTGVAANIGRPAAGKTGTTSDFTNAWFAGYTPTLSTAVWMGYANNQSTRLQNIRYGGKQLFGQVFGGTIPALTWHNFMGAALKDVPPTDFSQPAPIKSIVDQAKLTQRGGFDAGAQRPLQDSGAGGPYEYVQPPPVADLPTTSTSTSTTSPPPPPTATTVTIVPPPKK